MSTPKYSFTVEWSEEDNDFIARCPTFPGLSAFGPTPVEAIAEGVIALDLFLDSHRANHLPLPENRSIPPGVDFLASAALTQARLAKSKLSDVKTEDQKSQHLLNDILVHHVSLIDMLEEINAKLKLK